MLAQRVRASGLVSLRLSTSKGLSRRLHAGGRSLMQQQGQQQGQQQQQHLSKARVPSQAGAVAWRRTLSGGAGSTKGGGASAPRAGSSSDAFMTGEMDRLAKAKLVKDVHGTPFTLRSTAILPLSIVENRRLKAALPMVGNAAYIIIT
jgi:hypothetical protein